MKSQKQIEELIKQQIEIIESNFKKIRYNFFLIYINESILCKNNDKVLIQKFRLN